MAVQYPAHLPAPQQVTLVPAPRRFDSPAGAGPLASRNAQRDRTAQASLLFVLTQAQWPQWYTWWYDQVDQGAAWFHAANWPVPWGGDVVAALDGGLQVTERAGGTMEVQVDAWLRGAGVLPQYRYTFDALLAMLMEELQPMSPTVTTPRWLPDSNGAQWYVRPLSAMATNSASADRFLSAIDAGEGGTVNHPLAGARLPDPIDPASVVALAYDSNDWTGTPIPLATQVLQVVEDEVLVYYIRAVGGPVGGTVRLTWRYAASAALNGTSYATAWPGLSAVQWGAGGVSAGQTLWICGTFEDQTLIIGASGTAGNYIKLRFDYPSDPGRINQAPVVTRPWTQQGSEWWIPLPNVTDCMVYEDRERLVGVNTRSRCRSAITAVNAADNTISFSQIRRILTGHPIDIGSDFDADKLPGGLSQNTRYYAIVVSSTWAFYSVSAAQYVIKLAATPADAAAGVAVDLSDPVSAPPPNAFVFLRQTDFPFFDPVPGSLQPGQYAVDVVQQRLYYRPTIGTPADHELRVASETYAQVGACVYGNGVSYIRVLGGGQYGGLFDDTPAPAGRVGLAHQNCLQFENGAHVVVDGLLIDGCRSGVAFVNTPYGTVRNCRIRNVAHHACGGEALVGIQEPYLLLERNWITEIGDKHEFGDAQALVTNPDCHDAIFRRNYVQYLGRNVKVSNPSVVVFDGSDNISAYLNWADNCYGKVFELGAGNGEPITSNPIIVANIVTRQGQRALVDPADNLVQRTGVLHMVLNGPTDPGVDDAKVWGNLVAECTIGARAPDTQDDCGAIYMRVNNNSGSGSNVLESFRRNALLGVEGPVFALQKNANASAAPWPSITADRNLYASVPDAGFAIRTSSGTLVNSYSVANWTSTLGQDATSRIVPLDRQPPRGVPTREELEILRLHDDHDTYALPTIAMVRGFPFADGGDA